MSQVLDGWRNIGNVGFAEIESLDALLPAGDEGAGDVEVGGGQPPPTALTGAFVPVANLQHRTSMNR